MIHRACPWCDTANHLKVTLTISRDIFKTAVPLAKIVLPVVMCEGCNTLGPHGELHASWTVQGNLTDECHHSAWAAWNKAIPNRGIVQ